MKISHLLVAFVALALSCSTIARENTQVYKNEIRAVVESFRLAIINKDKATFKLLFYSDKIPWIPVFSDEMVAEQRKTKADFPRSVDFGQFGPPENMISDKEKQEEKMSDIKIETDGYLASVHFKYSDHRNGVKKAFGTEAWDYLQSTQENHK
ncbi:MAG: hypothetical protein HRT35_17075 [Algicola sp.]|nr:hypothetical protein [Algicola sp.]